MKHILFIVLILPAFLMAQSEKSDQTKVKISTRFGDIVAVLYDETPKHKENFIKLIKEGWYNQSPIHRVVEGFVIQGGQHADGRRDPGYTVPAEIVDGFIHKRGALAAARKPDQVNPDKASSGSQFYIVQGNIYPERKIDMLAERMGKTFSNKQYDIYTTVGGAPHLDGDYTIFGEVIEGMDVVDKIASVELVNGSVPKDKITMTVSIIE